MFNTTYIFNYGGYKYKLHYEGRSFVRYTKWNDRGQQVDGGLISATSYNEAKLIIMGD